MQQDAFLKQLSILSESEEIRRQLYLSKPSITVSPPRSEEEIEQFFSLARTKGISVSPEVQQQLRDAGPFTGVIPEEFVQLGDQVSITAQLHPRYVVGGLHTHEYFEIVCVCQGNAQQTICGRRMELRTGDYCIIAPGVQHEITCFSNAVIINIAIRRKSFDRTFFQLLSQGDILHQFFSGVLYGGSDYPYILFQTGTDPELLDCVQKLYQETRQPGAYSGSFRFTCISMLFLRLLRCHSEHIQTGIPGSNNLATVVPILQYMQTHYASISRASTAQAFHYHESYLSRLIKKTTGQSFVQLLQELRLQKARQLLTSTDISISEIASMVGFHSASHFHKLYLKCYGKTPGEERTT